MMIPHSAFFVMGEGPIEEWREPIALVTEVGDFGSYRLGSGSGALVERRKSGAELHCVFNSDLQVRGGMSFIPTQWREDAWNLVSVEVLLTRPDGREFSISAEGPAARMIEELPGLRSFIDSLLDAP